MIFPRLHRILAPLLLSMLLLVTSCATQAPSRWDQAQQDSTSRRTQTQQRQPTDGQNRVPAGKPVSGGSFNKFFPSAGGGYQRVYTQEKQGFAEAKLKKGGTDVAVLSISDTANNPSAAQKFQRSSQKIAGYPAVKQGNNGTAVLVGDRYQVKVQSRDPSFTESDRQAWLQKFNLNGLARLR
ncbi:MAG: hypothetical protein KME08_21100 [Aphanothece sp. CMT-3BRIN-NPC111]|nr:hypothetical protein [Aphanothece sp. CMT-3BRIN-NPC111]